MTPPPTGSSAGRNRSGDLIRLVAVIVVVVGHWLDTTTIIFVDGAPVGQSTLAVVDDIRWLTLARQVMPLFFVAAGYAAAASWPSWTARLGRWPGWLYGRLTRVLQPTTWFVASVAGLAGGAWLLGADSGVLAQAGWGVALQLLIFPIYLLLLALPAPEDQCCQQQHVPVHEASPSRAHPRMVRRLDRRP